MQDDRNKEGSNQPTAAPAPRKSIKELAALHKAQAEKVAASPEKKAPGLVKRVKTTDNNSLGSAVAPPKPQPQAQQPQSPAKSIFTAEELESRRKNREALKQAMLAPAKAPAKKVIQTGLNREAFLARKETIIKQIEAKLSGNRVEMRGQMREAVQKAFAEEMRNAVRQEVVAQPQSAEVIDFGSNNNARVASPASAQMPSAVQPRSATVSSFFANVVPVEANPQSIEVAKGTRAAGIALITPEASSSMRGAQGSVARSVRDIVTMDFCRRAILVKLPEGFVVTMEMIQETLDSFIKHARAHNFDFDREESLLEYATDISLLRCYLDANPEIASVIYAMLEGDMMDDMKKSVMVAVSPALRNLVEANAINADHAGFDGSVCDYVDQVKTVDLLLSGNEELLRSKFFGGMN